MVEFYHSIGPHVETVNQCCFNVGPALGRQPVLLCWGIPHFHMPINVGGFEDLGAHSLITVLFMISYISAALETREKQNKNSGKQKGKRMPSASPLGSAEHRSKKTLVENMDDESDSESDSDSVYSHDPTPSSSTAPPTTTPIEH